MKLDKHKEETLKTSVKVEDHKSWIEQLEEAINSPSEIVPEINSLEDLEEWLSTGDDFSKEELKSEFKTLWYNKPFKGDME